MTRRRFVYTEQGRPLPEPYEVGADWTDAPEKTAPVVDLYMDGTRTTDGVDIGSRAKRRAYMKATGYADSTDFTETVAKAAKQREALRQNGDPSLREDIGRALYEVKRKTRR